MTSELFGGPYDGMFCESSDPVLRFYTLGSHRISCYVRLGDDYEFSAYEAPGGGEAVDCCSCGRAVLPGDSVDVQGRCMCATCFLDCGRGVE